MGIFLALIVLFFASAIQSGLAPQIRILGGLPDLVFLIVLAWSARAKLEEAISWAFIGGILQDMLSIIPLGISTLGMILIAFMIEQLRRQFFNIPFVIMLGFVVVGTVLQQFIKLVFLLLTGIEIDPVTAISFVLAPTVLYNIVAFFPIYLFVRFMRNRITTRRAITR